MFCFFFVALYMFKFGQGKVVVFFWWPFTQQSALGRSPACSESKSLSMCLLTSWPVRGGELWSCAVCTYHMASARSGAGSGVGDGNSGVSAHASLEVAERAHQGGFGGQEGLQQKFENLNL